MTDRLTEITTLSNALHDIPDDVEVPVTAGLVYDLLNVAKTAMDVPIQHEARCAVWNQDLRRIPVVSPPCDCRVKAFTAALVKLEGMS